MDLFTNENDFSFFLESLKKYKGDTAVELFAYCLMDNHVHLLLRADNDKLPLFLKKVEVRYSRHFNDVYSSCGHIFQGRYKSECIDNERYFMSALRYIIRNPENANICNWMDYKWSSANDYIRNNFDALTDGKLTHELLQRKTGIISLLSDPIDIQLAEPNPKRKSITDAEARSIIQDIANALGYDYLNNRPSELRKEFITRISKTALSIRQLERVSGISRGVLQNSILYSLRNC